MVRVSRNLRQAASLLICVGIAGCGSSDDGKGDDAMSRPGLISFTPMYSAFDGVHTYQLTPSVPAVKDAAQGGDPVDESTLKWKVDDAFVKMEPFSEIPGAVLLTTKKSGTTTVSVTATTKGGIKIKGESKLEISKADPGDWDKGDMRYNNGVMINIFGMGGAAMPPPAGGMLPAAGTGSCGLPIDLSGRIPTNASCGNCHNSMSGITVEHTPTQTAGYSNDQLIEIFTQGMKPAGGTFNSPFLKMLPMPDCIYKTFHTWDIDQETKNGIVWKLRSLTPKAQAEVDIMRLIMMGIQARMNAAGAPASGGAAGSQP